MKFVFFPVSENGENGLDAEGADRGNAPPPQNFWTRTATGFVCVQIPSTTAVATVCCRKTV